MHIEQTELPGLKVIQPDVNGDSRGFFMEAFNKRKFAEAGITLEVLQHNQSRSQKGVVRGLHFQWDKPLGKLMRVVRGSAFVVAADIRKDSSTRGKWFSREFSDETKELIWAPFGFATGFCALEDNTEVEYYYNAIYNKDGESNILWSDPDISIDWPIKEPLLSERDQNAQTFAQWFTRPESELICLSVDRRTE